jgi:hypothetical protein
VFLSTDNGTSWKAASTGLTNTHVDAFAVSGANLFAGTSDSGVFLSTDNGTSWTSASNGLVSNALEITALAVSGANLFAGTYGSGVIRSTDNGTSWTGANTGNEFDHFVFALAVSGTNLFAGTEGGGVWLRPLSNFAAVDRSEARASSLSNYPNPFSQSTQIAFTSESGYAKVSVVNLLGGEVARLFDGTMDAGAHSFTWNANDIAPGMYECVVRQDDRIQRIPIMRLR